MPNGKPGEEHYTIDVFNGINYRVLRNAAGTELARFAHDDKPIPDSPDETERRTLVGKALWTPAESYGALKLILKTLKF